MPAAEHRVGPWLSLGNGWFGRQEAPAQLRTGESLLTRSAGPASHLTPIFSGPSFEHSCHGIEIKPEQSWGGMRNTKKKIHDYSKELSLPTSPCMPAPQPRGLQLDHACSRALQARAHHSPELLFACYLACKAKSLRYLREESWKAYISG